MIDNKTVLAIIPARGGSKRLPNKNILLFENQPLICQSIEASNQSKYIDFTLVSTDNQKILETSKKCGAHVNGIRPENLSTDDTSTYSVIEYEINSLDKNYDIIVLLQPTSPLRTCVHIDHALELMNGNKTSSVVSIVEAKHPKEWMFSLDDNMKIIRDKHEQHTRYPKSYHLNGAIYASNTLEYLKKKTFINNDTSVFIMEPEYSIDIDTKLDFFIALKIKEDFN